MLFLKLIRLILIQCVAVCLILLSNPGVLSAQPEDFQGAVAGEKWDVLHLRNPRMKGSRPLPKNGKLASITDLTLTGPKPGHPFVLGNYSTDGSFGLVNGYLQRTDGHDAALLLCWADQFELEGIMEHTEYGGWFFLVGWDQGHGYGISNVNMKVSGSPWFVSEFRGDKAIEGQTTELDHFDWKREQPFLLRVKENQVSLQVGRFSVVDFPLENYKPGRVILGVYETQYGTKPIRVKSLRVREVTGN